MNIFFCNTLLFYKAKTKRKFGSEVMRNVTVFYRLVKEVRMKRIVCSRFPGVGGTFLRLTSSFDTHQKQKQKIGLLNERVRPA